jgi:hypothetical protein
MRALRARVRAYYSGTIERHGPTPLGVDWPNAASQYLRFVQLLKLCDFSKPFSLTDFGCGYGALLEFLELRHAGAAVTYRGVDFSPPMVDAARKRWKKTTHATFAVGSRCARVADYALASGIFNVRLGHPVEDWESYVQSILTDMLSKSRIGVSVNFMLPHEARPTEQGLYRCEPQRWIGYCRGSLGCDVECLTGYGLREFTLLLHRTPRGHARRGAAPHRPSSRSPR